MRRRAVLLIGISWLIARAPAVALADPPGPTDYLSDVTAVDPATGGFEIEIIGGDSFVLLRVEQGTRAEVIGYQGEPYLRFAGDGTVEENAASPSKYLNEERYGGDLPAAADATAPPDWRVVADDGSYAWHDHRTHWMNPQPPPGLGPGDQVAEGVVPLVVDGVEVDVTVKSVWQEPPSPIPVTAGLIVGLALAGLVFTRWRHQAAWVIVALAGAATSLGLTAYLSVPPETGPIWSLWVLPATSLAVAGSVVVRQGRGGVVDRQRNMLLLLAALELVAWGMVHWDWLWPAIIPTSAPFWLDRFGAVVVLAGSLGSAAAVVAATTRAAYPD
jgi:hypothetical protein